VQVGDMVIRKLPERGPCWQAPAKNQRREQGHGLILTKQMGGKNPTHPCITVFYTKSGQIYDIAESLMEVISESR
jgi:hypothetical protein